MEQQKKKNPKVEPTESVGEEICGKCGSVMIEEDGVFFCPNCDGEIDFLGDEDEL